MQNWVQPSGPALNKLYCFSCGPWKKYRPPLYSRCMCALKFPAYLLRDFRSFLFVMPCNYVLVCAVAFFLYRTVLCYDVLTLHSSYWRVCWRLYMNTIEETNQVFSRVVLNNCKMVTNFISPCFGLATSKHQVVQLEGWRTFLHCYNLVNPSTSKNLRRFIKYDTLLTTLKSLHLLPTSAGTGNL